jgi:DNA-binding response OmpR family regulator
LRRKIEDDGELIKTVRGAGYIFAPDVERFG